MLKLFNINMLPNDKEYVPVPWDSYFLTKKVAKYLDETDTRIVQSVEDTSLNDDGTIQGKFSGIPIGIGCMSEGCKTLLCINHAIKTKTIDRYIFNITSCGGNAVEYLAKELASDVDVYACIEHGDLGLFSNTPIDVNGEIFMDALDASTRLIDIQGEWYFERVIN